MEAPLGTIKCWCVLPNDEGTSLLVRVTELGISMPYIDLPRNRLGFFPDQVLDVSKGIHQLLHADVTVLRHLHGDENAQICLLELQSPLDQIPEGYVWIDARSNWQPDPEDPEKFVWVDEYVWEDEPSKRAWNRWKDVHGPLTRVAPWEEIGWFSHAKEWMEAKLAELGYRQTGRVRQIKAGWGWSSILNAETDRGTVFMKADYRRPPKEVSVIQLLAERWPNNVPRVIAADIERNWMLMTAFPGECLERRDTADHIAALVKFAEIQRATADETEKWLAIKCRDMRPESLLELTRKLAADKHWLRVGPDKFLYFDLKELEQKLPRIESILEQLANSKIPNVIGNEDFRSGNIRIHNGEFIYFDWSATVITHPFFGLNYFLNRMIRGARDDAFRWRIDLEDPMRSPLAQAYLVQWSDYATADEIKTDFWLCRRLFYLYEALRAYTDHRFLDTDTPWAEGTISYVPHSLRRCLTAIDEIDALPYSA